MMWEVSGPIFLKVMVLVGLVAHQRHLLIMLEAPDQ
jgi:hypothetical protein